MAAGRPRSFDATVALDKALLVFWEKGYEGTSLADLTEAMGINRPSLYAAFGNKEELFCKALDRYAEGPTSYIREALGEPTARAVARYMLLGAVEMLTNPVNPRGCLWVQGALTCGDEAEPIRRRLAAKRVEGEKALCERFRRAAGEGEFASPKEAEAMARFIATVAVGLGVQAATGAGKQDLLGVVETALELLPG